MLFSCEKLQFSDEVFNDLIPEELLCGTPTGATNALLFLEVTAQMEQIANNLIGIIGLGHDGVLEGNGIIFACAARDGNALGGHHFETHQAKGFVAAVCQRGVRSSIDSAHKLFG